MSIHTALTDKLAISHPVLLAPMDLVSDARLTAAVSAAGGFGILGGGYGDAAWLGEQLDRLADAHVRFGVGFITWSMARQQRLLDIARLVDAEACVFTCGERPGLWPVASSMATGESSRTAWPPCEILRENASPAVTWTVVRPSGLEADVSRLRSALGWAPAVSLQDGIRRTGQAILGEKR